jgi:signal transduction histidine kinase
LNFPTIAKSKFLPVIILFIDCLLFLLLYDYNTKQVEAYKSTRLQSLADDYKAALVAHENITRNVFDLVVKQDGVLSLIASAYDQGDKNDTIRAKLQENLTGAYDTLKKSGLKQLHIHTTSGYSFLRMHQPKSFGDSLADVRPSIKIANFDKKYALGFEEGRVYNGFRYVHPLFWRDKHIGSAETSISSREMMSYLKSINNGKYQMYVDRKVVEGTVWKKEATQNYQASSLSLGLMEETANKNDTLIERINHKIADEVKEPLSCFKPYVISAHIDGKPYVAIFLPIKNIVGKDVAYIVRYIQDDGLRLISQDFWIKAVMDICATLALMLIVIVLRREIRLKEAAQAELETLNASLSQEVAKQIDTIKNKDKLLFRQSKHAAMGEMIGAIAHQWKQPLNALWINIQDLRLAYELSEVSKKYIDDFYTASKQQVYHMSQTIEDFRNFFNTDGQKESVDAMKVVQNSIALISNQFMRHGISVDVIGNSFATLGKSSDLKQVVINLVNNAADQIISVSKEDPSVERRIVVNIFTDEKGGHIIVEDFAGGIKEENLPMLFDAYFTTKDNEHGTGIGLYMSKLIATDMFGGDIVVSNGERGAIFDVILPLV